VASEFIEYPLAIHSTDFGIREDVDIARTDEGSDIVSRHFNVQVKEPEDLEKIKMPGLTYDAEMTDLASEAMTDLCRDIIPVQKIGQTHIWFIMKDISTVSHKPERLWEWETLTMETIQEHYE